MMHDVSLWAFVFLFFVAIVGGMIDAVAGGGGILTLPSLLLTGLPPLTALGTNRFQGCIGEAVASAHFFRSGKIKFATLLPCLIMSMIGASLGTIVVQHVNMVWLRKIIPVLILFIILYSIFSGKLFNKEKRYTLPLYVFAILFGLLIGFYNGFFGPGTGSFWVLAFFLFLGQTLQFSTIYAKPVNFVGNVASFSWFVSQGHVAIVVAIVMGLGQIVGASIGANMVLKQGAKIIKPIFITVVVLMTVELLLKETHSIF